MKQSPELQYSIRLKDIFFPKVNLSVGDELKKNIGPELNVNLQFEISPYPGNSRLYQILFNVSVKNEDTNFNLDVVSVAFFETNIDIDEQFLNSVFTKVNSPAIAFPFVRSFINTLTSNAGFHPVILPAYNFTQSKPVDDESPGNPVQP